MILRDTLLSGTTVVCLHQLCGWAGFLSTKSYSRRNPTKRCHRFDHKPQKTEHSRLSTSHYTTQPTEAYTKQQGEQCCPYLTRHTQDIHAHKHTHTHLRHPCIENFPPRSKVLRHRPGRHHLSLYPCRSHCITTSTTTVTTTFTTRRRTRRRGQASGQALPSRVLSSRR